MQTLLRRSIVSVILKTKSKIGQRSLEECVTSRQNEKLRRINKVNWICLRIVVNVTQVMHLLLLFLLFFRYLPSDWYLCYSCYIHSYWMMLLWCSDGTITEYLLDKENKGVATCLFTLFHPRLRWCLIVAARFTLNEYRNTKKERTGHLHRHVFCDFRLCVLVFLNCIHKLLKINDAFIEHINSFHHRG